MGGVWGREEETEDEETAGEEEDEVEEVEEDEEDLRGGSPSGEGGGEVSYQDEEVNRALVDNIKEKINKLEATVRFEQNLTQRIHQKSTLSSQSYNTTIITTIISKVIEKEASLKKRVDALEVLKIPHFLLFLFRIFFTLSFAFFFILFYTFLLFPFLPFLLINFAI